MLIGIFSVLLQLICLLWFLTGVVPEYQCAIKRETKKAQKDKDKPNSTTRDSGSDKEEKPVGSPNGPISQPKAMSKAQEDLISRLVVYQEEYESPSDEDFKKITVSFSVLFWIQYLNFLLTLSPK